jgi:hypothetical protein
MRQVMAGDGEGHTTAVVACPGATTTNDPCPAIINVLARVVGSEGQDEGYIYNLSAEL